MTKAEFFVQNYPKRSLNNYSEPYYGYPEKLIREMIILAGDADWKNITIAVMDDFNLELVKYLHFKLNVPFEHISLVVSNYNLKKLCEIQFGIVGIQIYGLDDEMMFDLIIANPPYGVGNSLAKKILKRILPNAKSILNLCPKNTYKDSSILTKIEEIKVVDNPFDAEINSLSVARLNNSTKNSKISFEDFCLTDKQKQLLKAVLDYNKTHTLTYTTVGLLGTFEKDLDKKLKFQQSIKAEEITIRQARDRDLLFAYMKWTPANGVPKNESYDILWNISHIWPPYKKAGLPINAIYFQSETERNNFRDWWYSCLRLQTTNKKLRVGLTNALLDLIVAIKSGSGAGYDIYFPHLDWSHPWTDEEILKEIGLPENFLTE